MNQKYQNDKTFLKIVDLVLDSEAGYANHPNDPGGPTMRGVAWNYNAGYLKEKFGFKTSADIKKLTKEQAIQTYYDRYWLASDSDGITDVDLAYIHFDAAVNCGVGAAASFLRKLSVNPKNYDGSGGKNRTLFMGLFLEYTAHRLQYYTNCRNRQTFLAGWVNRMVDVIRNSEDLD